ncbi:MAG: helix-turn-helix domain-containing protein [Oscillospiraceae bacterium]|nr:helix-turn-helix domain-containing protein [Oscillospiraceae bacterium]
MNFKLVLDQILTELHCTAKELAEVSGLSEPVLSRYRSGERTPPAYAFEKIAEGTKRLAEQKKITLSLEILTNLEKLSHIKKSEFSAANFEKLLSTLKISLKNLAPYVGFAPSYLSKIKMGQRSPHHKEQFLNGICNYLENLDEKESETLCKLLKISQSDDYHQALSLFLWNENIQNHDNTIQFLQNLDDFDLNDYLSGMHFQKLEVPKTEKIPEMRENYYGTERMRQGELNFFRMTLLSESYESIFMHNDLPLAEMAQDMDFNRNWMTAIALCLKRGLHLDMIHEINRPMDEMLLGLQAWIPMYMTGLLSSYYFQNNSTTIYRHMNYVSGEVALTGECITGYHNDGVYHLSTNPTEVAYTKKKVAHLLEKAIPLVNFYDKAKQTDFERFLTALPEQSGDVLTVHSSLPFHSMPEGLLQNILNRHNLPDDEKSRLFQLYEQENNRFRQALKKDTLIEIVPELTQAQFTVNPLRVSLMNGFYETPIIYTYEEYCEHLEVLRNFENYRYRLILKEHRPFQNMKITLKKKQYAIFSKENSPMTHLVLHHPAMIATIENYCYSLI